MSQPRLFYVIGPSGAGKDTLIQYARARLTGQDKVAFAHRYITRPADAGGENHVALSEAEFERLQARGGFALCWRSHGLRYGIGIEVEHWLQTGLSVVVNGSRASLDEAASRYPQLVPVLVEADPEILGARLRQRGREDEADIDRRLQRAQAQQGSIAHPALVRIDNGGPLERAGSELVALFRLGHLPV